MSTIKMYGYLRPHSGIKPHQVSGASNDELAEALLWTTHDWRDDPEWLCVATAEFSIQRQPNVAEAAVKALRQQQTEARAAFEARMVEIERQINSLLAITHEVTA